MSRKTEIKGIFAIYNLVDESNSLDAYIEINDKTPIWDGHLSVYHPKKNNNDFKKSEFRYKVPIQVKARTINKVKKDVIYKISKDDLRAYGADGGVLLLMVEINGKYTTVYYNCLLPYDIQSYLKSKQYKIKLSKIKEYKHLEEVCEDFNMHRKIQYSFEGKTMKLEDADKLIIKSALKRDHYKHILSNKVYLYGKMDAKYAMPHIIGITEIEKITSSFNKEIKIDNKVFFNNFKIERTAESFTVKIEEKLNLVFTRRQLDIQYEYHDNLQRVINCLEFINELIKELTIELAGELINLSDSLKDIQQSEQFKKDYIFFTDLAKLYTRFNVRFSDIKLTNLNEKSYDTINFLLRTIIYKEKIDIPYESALFMLEIGVSVLVIVLKNEKGKIQIEDINKCIADASMICKADDVSHKVSPYILLTKNELINAYNIEINDIYDDIIRYEYSEIYNHYVILLILELISAYDMTFDSVYLNIAKKLSEWLHKYKVNDKYQLINKHQIAYRQGDLSKEDKQDLNELLNKECGNDIMLKCSILLLLDKKNEFEKEFLKMNCSDIEIYKQYPIYNLYNKK